MAKYDTTSAIESINGKLNKKDKLVFRFTRRYAANGKLLMEKKHAYSIEDKRDYEKTPPRGAEKANLDLMAEANRLTKIELAPTSDTIPAWGERFEKQLKSGTPDPEAPILAKTHKRKVYLQFDRFVFAILYARLRRAAGINC